MKDNLIQYKIFYLNGNICGGKTTFCDFIEKNEKNVFVVRENVDSGEGNELLSKYSKDPKAFAFDFDKFILKDKLKQIKEIYEKVKKLDECTLVFDRSVRYDINVFSQIRFNNGWINEIQFEELKEIGKEIDLEINNKFKDYKIFKFYIDVDHKLSYERYIKRSRNGEKLSLEYLICTENLHKQTNESDEIILLAVDTIKTQYDQLKKIIN